MDWLDKALLSFFSSINFLFLAKSRPRIIPLYAESATAKTCGGGGGEEEEEEEEALSLVLLLLWAVLPPFANSSPCL